MADVREKLHQQYTEVVGECIECVLCRKDCLFLKKYDSPRQIAEQGLAGKDMLEQIFECSLCSLCSEVCPKDIDPGAMFRTMRTVAHNAGYGQFRAHRGLLSYERWGMSPLFSWYGLPSKCDTVFFPGCAILGSRFRRVIEVYQFLRRKIPELGLVIDCCAKPSHDLGRQAFFRQTFGAIKKFLAAHGVKKILVACPSCYSVWRDYGGRISVTTIYEQLAENDLPVHGRYRKTVAVHDPCAVRRDTAIHQAVRKLIRALGLDIREMEHSGRKTICCGEGGAAGYVAPEFADNWAKLRAEEAENNQIITYCGGCTQYLGRLLQTDHVMDLLFEPAATLEGKIKVPRSPMTWVQRLAMKKKLPGIVRPEITGARNRKAEVVTT